MHPENILTDDDGPADRDSSGVLSHPPHSIGVRLPSASACSLVVDRRIVDGYASRKHACFILSDEGGVLQDPRRTRDG